MKPLAIIPTYLRSAQDFELVQTTITTFRGSVGDKADLLVVDDGSPESDLVKAARLAAEAAGGELVARTRNDGFATTVNVGLARCLEEGRDAVLINADMEFTDSDWLDHMLEQPPIDSSYEPWVVGARLLYANGLIQHAGVYFSLLYREFDHIYRHGPGNLPEALVPRVCPVTAALQLIRVDALRTVGLYDEKFRLGWEDVDFCIRVWLAGRQCVYCPEAVAIHHESQFRTHARATRKMKEWTAHSWLYFAHKYAKTSFAEFVPNVF